MTETSCLYTDEIRDYFREIHLKRVRSLDEAIIEKYGSIRGSVIVNQMLNFFDEQDKRFEHINFAQPDMFRTDDLVEICNQTYALSMMCSGFYDHAFFRNVLELVCQYPDCMKGSVYDVGCGNGIITSFLARHFPECAFTGADISLNAHSVAETIKKHLNLSNISFTMHEHVTKETDTLLSFRVLHENLPSCELDIDLFSEDLEPHQLPAKAYMMYTNAKRDFPFWTAHVRHGGHLIVCERIYSKGAWQILCKVLAECGFAFREDSHRVFSCKTGDETSTFTFGVFDRIL